MDDVNIEILDGGLGLLPSSGDEVHAVIGSSPLGAIGSIVATRSIENLILARGVGPGTEAAAFALKATGKTVLFCNAGIATPGAIKEAAATPIAITSSTNAVPPVVTTTTPHGRKTGDVVTIAGHLVNTTVNGTRPIIVLSPTTFSLPGITGAGVGVATGTVQPKGINVSQTPTFGTSIPSITGTPLDVGAWRWQWVKGGTIGTAGITFQLSRDGGQTWGAELNLGTVSSYVIPDSGLTVSHAAGTVVAGTMFKWYTTPPKWSVANVQACIAALGASTMKFRLIHLVGDLTAADAVTLGTDLDNLTNGYRYTGLLGHVRDVDATLDTDENYWAADMAAEFSAISDTRISVTAGHYSIVSPIGGHKYRRPLSFVMAARLMARPIQEHAGRVKTGALKGISKPTEADATRLALDPLVYHDSRVSPALKAARFVTARTRVGRPGWFIDRPAMMSSPSSDFQLWPHRSVIDKTCDLTYEVLVDVLNDDLQLDPTNGTILDKEAKAIESRMRSAFRDGLTAPRAASAASGTVSRENNVITTKKIIAAVRVIPKGFVEAIDVTVGYTNPSLELGA